MSFYTYAEQIGNKIYHRFIDDKGKRKTEVVREFPINLYVKTTPSRATSVSLMGDSLGNVSFNDISDATGFIKEYQDTQEIFGQTSLVYQFLAHQYPEQILFDFDMIKTLIIDIETAYDSSGFPTPDKAQHPILTIACKVLGSKDPFIVFGTKECKKNSHFDYIKCDNEEHLLQMFQQYWREEVNPDFITGWNVEQFDIPYIINRCNKIMGEDFTKKFSPFYGTLDKPITSSSSSNKSSKSNKSDKDVIYNISGIIVIDYLMLYKKYSMATLENYRLDTVAKYELGMGKVDYSEFNGLMGLYEKNYDLFLYYNFVDVKIIEDLEKKLNFLFLVSTLTYLGKSKYTDSFGVVKWWDVYIYNQLLKKNIQIPPAKRKGLDDTGIVGAFVKDPIPQLYSWIVTLDLTSLYPSIIMSFNLSPEMVYRSATFGLENIDRLIDFKDDLSWLKESNVAMLANGATFKRDKQGILPELVDGMFASRKEFKKHMLKATGELETLKKNGASEKDIKEKEAEVSTFNCRQQAYKISLNSLYGATANSFFRYNSRDISEGITMTGQLIIRYISKRLNIKLNEMFKTSDIDYIIFNDTDSAGLNLQYLVDKMFPTDQSDTQKIVNFLDKFVNTHINPYLVQEFQALSDYLNTFQNRLSMNREVIADKGIWRGKKHYILQMWDKEGIRYTKPKLKMMGIETAKSSTPNIVRGSLEQAIKIILNGTEDELQRYVKSFHSEFISASIADIAFPRGVSDMDKWMDSSGKMIKGVPIHVRGSIVYNNLLKNVNSGEYPYIKNGDKIKFIYLKTPNKTHSHVISFLDNLPPELELASAVDKETQFSKTFLEPLKTLTDIVGWNTEKTYTLDIFFQ